MGTSIRVGEMRQWQGERMRLRGPFVVQREVEVDGQPAYTIYYEGTQRHGVAGAAELAEKSDLLVAVANPFTAQRYQHIEECDLCAQGLPCDVVDALAHQEAQYAAAQGDAEHAENVAAQQATNALEASRQTADAMDRFYAERDAATDPESGHMDNDVAGIIGMTIVAGGLITWFACGIIPALFS